MYLFLKPVDRMVSIKSLLVAAAFAATVVQAVFTNSSCETGPIIYPIPTGITLATSFNISVRSGNDKWQQVGTYSVNLNLINTTTGGSNIQKSSMAFFHFCDPVEISVTYNNAPISTAQIRPISYDMAPRVQGNTVVFTLSEPRNVVV